MNVKRYDLTAQNDLTEFYRDFESRRAGIKKDVTGPVTEILQQIKDLETRRYITIQNSLTVWIYGIPVFRYRQLK